MKKYKKNPLVIEAEQWFEGNDWIHPMTTCDCGKNEECHNCGKPVIETEEGPLAVSSGDYIIKGIKGEYYPCKSDIFEETYSLVSSDIKQSQPKNTYNFGQAIEALKRGHKVAREGWNGKGMFLFLLPAGKIPKSAINDGKLMEVLEGNGKDHFEALGSIRMKTADDKILTGWLASQTDMLAEDWCVVD